MMGLWVGREWWEVESPHHVRHQLLYLLAEGMLSCSHPTIPASERVVGSHHPHQSLSRSLFLLSFFIFIFSLLLSCTCQIEVLLPHRFNYFSGSVIVFRLHVKVSVIFPTFVAWNKLMNFSIFFFFF
jgi:hypothetical protein